MATVHNTKCVICSSKLNHGKSEEVLSSSSINFLDIQLDVIFTLRKIFELEPNQLESYLEKWGNPGEWLKFCRRCGEDVKNLRSVYQRLCSILREFEKKKCDIQERVRVRTVGDGVVRKRKNEEEDNVADECRRQFCERTEKKRMETQSSSSPSVMVSESVSEDLHHLKMNVADECRRLFCENAEKKRMKTPASSSSSSVMISESVSKDLDPIKRGNVKTDIKTETEEDNVEQIFQDLIILPATSSIANNIEDYYFHAEASNSESEGQDQTQEEILPEPLPRGSDSGTRSLNLRSRSLKKAKVKCADSDSDPDYSDHVEVEENNQKRSKRKKNVNSNSSSVRKSKKEQKKYKTWNSKSASAKAKTEVRCPFCGSKRSLETFPAFIKHFEECTRKLQKKVLSLNCSFCKNWSCYSNETRYYLQHIAMCKEDYKTLIPWRHSIVECNLCEGEHTTYLPFPEFAVHIFRCHQHEFGCTLCPYRSRLSHGVSGIHWKTQHKNLLKTPPKERYIRLPKGSKPPLPQIPWWCPAPECLMEFPDEDSRDLHILNSDSNCTSHSLERTSNCAFCGRNYFSEEELLMHRVTTHGYLVQNEGHHCGECNESFENRRLLTYHQRSRHNLKLFQCKEPGCNASFHLSDLYWTHMRLEHGTKEELKEFTCKVCSMIFGQRYQLRKHIQLEHTEVKKICEVCGREYDNELSFKSHKDKYHPKEIPSHPCTHPGCGKLFRTEHALKVHLTKNHSKILRPPQKPKSEYLCSCGKVFLLLRRFRSHTKICHLPKKVRARCRKCKVNFPSYELLHEHRRREHSKPLKSKLKYRTKPKYLKELDFTKVTLSEDKSSGTCNLCQKTFDSLRKLNFHVKTFHDDKLAVICDLCGDKCRSGRKLMTHMAKVHGQGVKCDVCNETFPSQFRLERHKTFAGHGHSNSGTGSEVKTFACSWESCGRIFTNHLQFMHHVKLDHKNKFKFSCDLCGAKRSNEKSLEFHMRNVHGQKQEKPKVECKVCKKMVANLGALKSHMRTHAPSKEKKKKEEVSEFCEICGKIFNKKGYLESHKAKMHGIGPFKCEVDGCSRAFLKEKQLVDHRRYIHEGVKREKTHFCQFCGKGFVLRFQMKLHEDAIHRNRDSKPFICELCGKTFSHKSYVAYHVKHTHNKVRRKGNNPRLQLE